VQDALQQALALVKDPPVERTSWVEMLSGSPFLGIWPRFGLGLALYLVGMLALLFWAKPGRQWLKLAGAVCLLVGLWGLVSVGGEEAYALYRPGGVVCGDGVVLREGNGPSFGAVRQDPLPAGCEFRVLKQRGAWQRIALADGTTGWIPQQPEV